MIKGYVHHKKLTLTTIYTPNEWQARYFKQPLTDLKKDLDINTILVGDFIGRCHLLIDQLKIHKEMLALKEEIKDT